MENKNYTKELYEQMLRDQGITDQSIIDEGWLDSLKQYGSQKVQAAKDAYQAGKQAFGKAVDVGTQALGTASNVAKSAERSVTGGINKAINTYKELTKLKPEEIQQLEKNITQLLTQIASEVGSTLETLKTDINQEPAKDLVTPEISEYIGKLYTFLDEVKKINSGGEQGTSGTAGQQGTSGEAGQTGTAGQQGTSGTAGQAGTVGGQETPNQTGTAGQADTSGGTQMDVEQLKTKYAPFIEKVVTGKNLDGIIKSLKVAVGDGAASKLSGDAVVAFKINPDKSYMFKIKIPSLGTTLGAGSTDNEFRRLRRGLAKTDAVFKLDEAFAPINSGDSTRASQVILSALSNFFSKQYTFKKGANEFNPLNKTYFNLAKDYVALFNALLGSSATSVAASWNEFINKAVAEKDKEAQKDPSIKDKAFGAAISSGKATFFFPKEKKAVEKPKEPSPSKAEEPKTDVPKEEPKGPMESYSILKFKDLIK